MEAAIIDNNTVRIYDGIVVSKGRDAHILANTYDDFTIETGTQNVTRYDIIGYRFYKSEGKELCESFVRKGVGVSEIIAEEDLREGAEEVFISMYRVKVVGLTITEITPLYAKIQSPMMNLQTQIQGVTSLPASAPDGEVYIVYE